MTTKAEIERRYLNVRQAMAAAEVSALIVCGSEYTGFDGAVRYLSGFRIVHRFAYVLLPLVGDPCAVFPSEARYVGAHSESWVEEKVFAEHPGAWMRQYLESSGARRVGVYGVDYVMPVRDYLALADGGLELVAFDEQFDLARAVKSAEELAEVRRTMEINEAGFWSVHAAYQPGRTQAELMAEAEREFARRGCGRHTMDMVLWGRRGAADPEFRIPESVDPIRDDDLLLYSLEVAGPSGYWVEFTRPLCRGVLAPDTLRMLVAYDQYFELARRTMKKGMTAHDVHRAVSQPFLDAGFGLGHVTGHSIGMTMIEHPRIGEGVEVELAEGMVFSMHPHAITGDGKSCLYMQDTWLVGADGAELLSGVAAKVFDGTEDRAG
ncbi:MAG: M24 family metallopeptidase [Candidatus Dormibacteria bacterium]